MNRTAITVGTVRNATNDMLLPKPAKTLIGTVKKKVVDVRIIRRNKRLVRIHGTARDIDTVI